MDKQQAKPIINKALTNLREMRTIAGELEVIGHRTFSIAGLDTVAAECVDQLRTALEALDTAQKAIKAAGRSLYIIDMPSLAMTAEAA